MEYPKLMQRAKERKNRGLGKLKKNKKEKNCVCKKTPAFKV